MHRLLAFLVFLMAATAPAANAPQDEILIGGNFTVSITGADSCRDTVSVEVDPIEIEMHDVTQSYDSNWKVFRSAAPRFGEARFSFRVEDKACAADVKTWMRELTILGDKARRSISIVLLDREGKEARRYSLNDSYPIAFAPAGSLRLTNDPGAKSRKTEELSELTVQIGSIEISGPGAAPDRRVRNARFTVEIQGADEVGASPDSSWQSADGGAVEIETIEETVGQSGSRHYEPGKAYVTELTLTGYMTPTRKALLQWMQNSAKGSGDLRRDVVISVEGSRPIDPRKQHHYYNCMITRVDIPRLSAGSAEPVREIVVLKAERYDDPA